MKKAIEWKKDHNPLVQHRDTRHSTGVAPDVAWWKFAEIYDYAEELQRAARCDSTSPKEELDMYRVGNVLKTAESCLHGRHYVIVTEEHVNVHTFATVTLNDCNGAHQVGQACEWPKGTILWQQSSLLEAANAR